MSNQTASTPKRRIKQTVWDNWNGYEGTRRVREFGTDQSAAEDWMNGCEQVAQAKDFTIKLSPAKPAINRKALALLHICTGHSFRIDRLAGDGMKEQRRQIMSALMGRKMPVSKSGINAIQHHFYLMAGPALDGWTCDADLGDKFAEWANGALERTVTAKNGLLYRDGEVIPLPEADELASRAGYQCAEKMVKALGGNKQKPSRSMTEQCAPPVKAVEVVKLTKQGARERVMDGAQGMTFIVDSDTVIWERRIVHVRDYRYPREISGTDYQIWSLGPEHYEAIK